MTGNLAKDEFGRQLLGIESLRKASPEAASFVTDLLIGDRKGFTEQVNKLRDKWKLQSLGVPPEDRKPPSAVDAIDEMQRHGGGAKSADDYINFLSTIKTKGLTNDQVRNMAYTYYNPQNAGMIGQFSSKTMNSRTGETENGQINVLKRMGDKDVLDRIKSIGDPKLNEHVKNFLESAISINVFPTLMKDMEDVTKAQGDRLGYDDKHQKFYLQGPNGQPIQSSSFVQNTIHRMNFISDAASNLADFVGAKDKNGYLIGLLSANNPNMFSREVKGFPGEINKAIMNQALARQMEAEQKAKSRKDLEGPGETSMKVPAGPVPIKTETVRKPELPKPPEFPQGIPMPRPRRDLRQ
jgi:hypothetical protein